MRFHPEIPVYGDKSYRGPCAHESVEQITFFARLRKDHQALGAIAIHPRNEGKRTPQQAARHKSEGMVKGAPDVIIPGDPTLCIEIKRRDHTQSHWDKGQMEYLLAARDNGAIVGVALGCDAAMELINDWRAVFI